MDVDATEKGTRINFILQTQFLGMEPSDFVANNVWDHVKKLERFHDRIVSCHVVISAPHHHKHQGNTYHVQIRLHVPGGEIIVTTEHEKNPAHSDVYVAVHDAFDAGRRRLEDFVRRQRSVMKEKAAAAHGKVVRIFPDDGFGFITTTDDREIYFHRNSVVGDEFDRLKVGDEVRFSEEAGEKGPQVSSMKRVGHSGHFLA
jgi:cold shock CspA family protein